MEGFLLLSIYILAAAALMLSISNYFDIKDLQAQQKKDSKQGKPGNAWDHYHDKARESKPKSLWS